MPMTPYSIPPEAWERLDCLVDRIEAAPGDMVKVSEWRDLEDELDLQRIVGTLPEGLDDDDLIGILKLAMLTECATESYGEQIKIQARRYGAGWLERFNDRVWTPDELTHHTPYKSILLKLGFSEAEINREVKETQEKQYEHHGGETPVHVSTFGMLQEYLTDHWHGLIAQLLKPASERGAALANHVKRRETLHTMWYRDMTALQVEADPSFVRYVAEEISRFRMPGNSLVPELQARAVAWLPLMGADMARVLKDVKRLFYTTAGTPRLAGELALELAARRGIELGPVSPRTLMAAFDRLGGRGYGIVGEALLQSSGLGYLYPRPEGPVKLHERIRGLVRDWLSARIRLEGGLTG